MEEQRLNRAQLDKILEIRKDFYRYCKNNLWIKDKHARIVKFEPNLPQRILIDYVLLCIEERRPIKAIILKARQMGLSTAVEAVIYWWTSTNKNINSVILGHEESSSKNLYAMFRRYYDKSNPVFKPSIKYNTKTDLSFERFDDEGNQVGLGSVIKTATAGNKSAGRSDTINCLHGSEVGLWEDGEALVGSILETVPDEEEMEKPSMIFLESTAKGRGNYFHKEWLAAEEGSNNFVPFFFPWWVLKTYERHDDEELGELTEYENFLVDLMTKGLKVAGQLIEIPVEDIPAKIKFYRRKAKNFKSTPEKLFEEYPSTSHEAFISSGKAVFNVLSLNKLEMDKLEESDIKHYDVVINEDNYEHSKIELREFSQAAYDEKPINEFGNGRLKIYTDPIRGHEYVIGGDVAEGLENGDWSIADVIDTTTMQTVARWRGHCDPDEFGDILAAIGKHFNYALIGVEVNNHGLTTVQKLRDIFYTNLYKREKGYDEDWEEPTSHLGWKTDMRSKRQAIDDLIMLIRKGVCGDNDHEFLREAFAFVRDKRGRMGAEAAEHDDTVMAKAIAYQLFDWGDNDLSGLVVVKPKGLTQNKRKHKMVK